MRGSDFEDLVTVELASVLILTSSSRLGFWTGITGRQDKKKGID